MGFTFYWKTAWKNIGNSKKQSILYSVGVIITFTLILSLQLWASTAEDLAARDFLIDQDYELKVTTYQTSDLPFILEWLENEPMVELTSDITYNIALFNAEDKPVTYKWMPENEQDDMNDPVAASTLTLLRNTSLERLKNQFLVRGEFDLGVNEVLISEFLAQDLQQIYGYEIQPGMQINVSIARRGPERGENYLYQCELKHFYNVTVRGIYRTIPTISMLQTTFSNSFLKDSIFFLIDNMNELDLAQMHDNGLTPIYMIKCNIVELKSEGISQILEKLRDLATRLDLDIPSSIITILESPTIELQQSYSLARTSFIFAIPVVVTSLILSLFVTNMVIENRRNQMETLQDRGGEKWQIIIILLLEFLILSIMSIAIAIPLAYVTAGLIPAFASKSLSWFAFSEFLSNVIFPFSLVFYLILGVFLLVGVFVIFKSFVIFNHKLEDKDKETREKIQKWVIIGVLLISIIAVAAIIIVLGYISHLQTVNVYKFTIEQTQDSMIVFLLITTLVLLLAVIGSIFFTKILGNMKWFFDKIAKKNAFFISSNFKNSKNKLSSILIILFIIASVNVFSMNLYATNARNEADEFYYNNGSDLRIQTSTVNINFNSTLAEIEGIDEVMPILRCEGLIGKKPITVYGVDPVVYSRIGRWDKSSVINDTQEKILNDLYLRDDGILISEDTITRLTNKTINSAYAIEELPNGTGRAWFNITGAIRSAPGLGLAFGINIELNQPYEEYVIINQRKMERDFAVLDTNLFIASIDAGYDVEEIKAELLLLPEILSVNPEIINQQFIGKFIGLYIPSVSSFLISQIILTNIIGLLIVGINIEFILTRRRQYNAILKSIGNSNKNLFRLIQSELLIVNITSIISGLIIGIPLAALMIFLNRPIFTSHNILPFIFSFDYIGIPIFITTLILMSSLTIIPSIVRFSRENLAIAISN